MLLSILYNKSPAYADKRIITLILYMSSNSLRNTRPREIPESHARSENKICESVPCENYV